MEVLSKMEGHILSDLGATALMAAATHGRPECVSILLKDMNTMTDNSGYTALMYAATKAMLRALNY